MRAAIVLPLLLAACGHGRPGRLAVSDDGRAAIAGGRSLHAPPGVTLTTGADGLRVVSRLPGARFDVVVPLDAEGRPLLPADAPFEVRDGDVVLRSRAVPAVADLLESGQLHPHDDHYHLTHRWENADWRALYAAREEGSMLPGATRQAAAYALATLVDRRIPGDSEEATAEGLRRLAVTVARARRAVEGQYPAKQIMAVVVHDLEIGDSGATLSIEGQAFEAVGGIRFTSCGDHFHVEEAGGAWAHVVPLSAFEPGHFEMPHSIFFEVSGAKVAPRAGDAPWRGLLARGQIALHGDRWFVTERYAHASFQQLAHAALDARVPSRLREAARRSVIELLKVPLDIEDDAAFEARLAAIDADADARWRALSAKMR